MDGVQLGRIRVVAGPPRGVTVRTTEEPGVDRFVPGVEVPAPWPAAAAVAAATTTAAWIMLKEIDGDIVSDEISPATMPIMTALTSVMTLFAAAVSAPFVRGCGRYLYRAVQGADIRSRTLTSLNTLDPIFAQNADPHAHHPLRSYGDRSAVRSRLAGAYTPVDTERLQNLLGQQDPLWRVASLLACGDSVLEMNAPALGRLFREQRNIALFPNMCSKLANLLLFHAERELLFRHPPQGGAEVVNLLRRTGAEHSKAAATGFGLWDRPPPLFSFEANGVTEQESWRPFIQDMANNRQTEQLYGLAVSAAGFEPAIKKAVIRSFLEIADQSNIAAFREHLRRLASMMLSEAPEILLELLRDPNAAVEDRLSRPGFEEVVGDAIHVLAGRGTVADAIPLLEWIDGARKTLLAHALLTAYCTAPGTEVAHRNEAIGTIRRVLCEEKVSRVELSVEQPCEVCMAEDGAGLLSESCDSVHCAQCIAEFMTSSDDGFDIRHIQLPCACPMHPLSPAHYGLLRTELPPLALDAIGQMLDEVEQHAGTPSSEGHAIDRLVSKLPRLEPPGTRNCADEDCEGFWIWQVAVSCCGCGQAPPRSAEEAALFAIGAANPSINQQGDLRDRQMPIDIELGTIRECPKCEAAVGRALNEAQTRPAIDPENNQLGCAALVCPCCRTSFNDRTGRTKNEQGGRFAATLHELGNGPRGYLLPSEVKRFPTDLERRAILELAVIRGLGFGAFSQTVRRWIDSGPNGPLLSPSLRVLGQEQWRRRPPHDRTRQAWWRLRGEFPETRPGAAVLLWVTTRPILARIEEMVRQRGGGAEVQPIVIPTPERRRDDAERAYSEAEVSAWAAAMVRACQQDAELGIGGAGLTQGLLESARVRSYLLPPESRLIPALSQRYVVQLLDSAKDELAMAEVVGRLALAEGGLEEWCAEWGEKVAAAGAALGQDNDAATFSTRLAESVRVSVFAMVRQARERAGPIRANE